MLWIHCKVKQVGLDPESRVIGCRAQCNAGGVSAVPVQGSVQGPSAFNFLIKIQVHLDLHNFLIKIQVHSDLHNFLIKIRVHSNFQTHLISNTCLLPVLPNSSVFSCLNIIQDPAHFLLCRARESANSGLILKRVVNVWGIRKSQIWADIKGSGKWMGHGKVSNLGKWMEHGKV